MRWQQLHWHMREIWMRTIISSHISPGGTSPIQRAIVKGYTGKDVLENIAKGYTSIEPLMQAWQQSEEHCKAMMDSLQTEMGAANVNTYWVQEFGR